ncbi:MAG: response regulator [Lachnospiraceae bacterium]|jgi:signal transduction histidine kinase/CheY-like chemotaxis protein|nr:response regulator [Lachnospiraceae bacterium]
MDRPEKMDFLLENEMQINRSIGVILYMGCMVGPAMFIFTQLNIFRVDFKFCLLFTAYAIITGLVQRFLSKNVKYHTIARYFGIFAFEFMIGLSATQATVGIYIAYSFATILSCLYVNRNYTRFVCIIGYIVMIVALYFRSLDQVRNHFIIESARDYFLGYGIGFTIEFVFLFFICMTVVKYEIKLLESKETEVNERLEAQQENKAKSDFLAQMSHEIRTPINAVLGMNEMIMRETDQPEVEGYARTIKSAGKSLLNIVNDILDFSKIQSGKMEIIEVDYDSGLLLRDLIELYSIPAVTKGLDFEYQISEDIPQTLCGDEYRIKQAAGNLISNAIKYTEKGFVNLQAEFVWTDKEKKEGNLILSVVDSGIGIKSEDVPKLFQNFGRLDLQKNRAIEGTGLGLKISKQLIEMMRGTMGVQSVYGEGSIFSITVPQIAVSEEVLGNFAESMKRQEEEALSLRNQRTVLAPEAELLVVDDNEMNLQVVASLLKKTQCKVQCVSSGEECIAAVKEKKYDLILLDHMMPQMDGIEVLHVLRDQDAPLVDRKTKIIVLTANAIAGAKDNYLKEGFDDYLSKPISIEELERVLMEYLPANKVSVEEGRGEEEVLSYPDLSEYGIDVAAGVKILDGDFDVYLEMAKVFYKDYEGKSEKINNALAECDMPSYAIYVHGLKSNARTLGAMELGELAFDEEKQSKSGNIHYIQTHVSKLMEEWDKVMKGFEVLFKEQGISETPEDASEVEVTEAPLDETEVLDRLLLTLAHLEEFQEEEARDSMKELLSHPLAEDLQKSLREALDHLYQFNYNKAFEVLSPYINEDQEKE